ncbi:MAG: glycosyltransferase [Johnsonella sp.]|nr:glycosyltransferase [Johnsonella sp.]
MLTEEKESVKVSVVMLTYNHRDYISQAIESVLAQLADFKIEVLIGDDASGDGTAQIVKEYAKRYPDIIRATLREKNIGPANNLVDLLKQCRGKYIAGCEGDDYWTDQNKLHIQVSFLEENPSYIACTHDVSRVDREGNPLKDQKISWISEKREYGLEDFRGIFLPGHPVSVLHKNIFHADCSPDTISRIHYTIADRTIAVMLACRGKIYRIPEIMAAYRIHTENKSNATHRIYSDFHSYLTDYELSKKLEMYIHENTGENIVFSDFERNLVLRATLKFFFRPSLKNFTLLKKIYRIHFKG